jgi:hypothetical protein
MPFLTDELAVRSCGPSWWVLDEDLVYRGREHRFVVPKGFYTDFASVPTLCTWLIPRYGVYTRAAVLHDYLCQEGHVGRFNRRDADGIFRRCLRELGVSWTRRWLMWAAVRVGGFMAGASAKEWLQLLVIAVVALPLIVLPVLVITVWAVLFWLIEVLDRGRQVERFEPPEYV